MSRSDRLALFEREGAELYFTKRTVTTLGPDLRVT